MKKMFIGSTAVFFVLLLAIAGVYSYSQTPRGVQAARIKRAAIEATPIEPSVIEVAPVSTTSSTPPRMKVPTRITPVGSPLLGVSLYDESPNHLAGKQPAITAQPLARWFMQPTNAVRAEATSLTSRAANRQQTAVIVAYNIPDRDCGSYSAGGAGNTSAYVEWVRELAAGIGNRSTIVILEPDALTGASCLTADAKTARYELLSQAVSILKGQSAAVVYLDAGHARWLSSSAAAEALKAVNIAQADGFSLNVSNFISTAESTVYGKKISQLVGGKHFVIDTSRNGQGPTGTNEWCNPRGRGLGKKPSTSTGDSAIDAYLWIKVPGESDGTCNGGPAAGLWWDEYATELAQNAQY